MASMSHMLEAITKLHGFLFNRHRISDSNMDKDGETKDCADCPQYTKSENQVDDTGDEWPSPKLKGDQGPVYTTGILEEQLFQESNSGAGGVECFPTKPVTLVTQAVEEKMITKVEAGSNEKGLKSTCKTTLDTAPYDTEKVSSKRYNNRCDKIGGSLPTQQKREEQQLEPLPPAPPVDVSAFPKSNRWSYDETTRVVHGDFTNSNTLDRDDEVFLLQMMERNDITVITDGFAGQLDPSLWTFPFIQDLVGEDVCHQFRIFQRRLLSPSHAPMGDKAPNEKQQLYESFAEEGLSCSLRMKDYIRYLQQREQQMHEIEKRRNEMGISALRLEEEYQYRHSEKELFTYEQGGEHRELNCIDTVLYLIDYDIGKLLPPLYKNFVNNFLASNLLPGGKYCWMHETNENARPFMGPNLYITPPGSFTDFHQDGHGTVDSGHQCLSGYNEVVMLRRMPETHKQNAMNILNGNNPASCYDALYGLPHREGAPPKTPRWPSKADIDKCMEMNYYPSVFILKPGQYVHINKGRLHAFRKLSPALLPEHDCHAQMREKILKQLSGKQLSDLSICISIAWDWTFRGFTSEAIHCELSSMLECAALNHKYRALSLAIPETSLLYTVKVLLARANLLLQSRDNGHNLLRFGSKYTLQDTSMSPEEETLTVLKGILPSLNHLFARHKASVVEAKGVALDDATRQPKLSIAECPDAWENPQFFSVDPYGNDFFCKICSYELSNIYLHCDGCEKILSKDFNICSSCYTKGSYKIKVQMHPLNVKNHSTINHTGHYTLCRRDRCPCKNGPVCKICHFCSGCSCTCHQSFTLRYRFMTIDAEEKLLDRVTAVVQTLDFRCNPAKQKGELYNSEPTPQCMSFDAKRNKRVRSSVKGETKVRITCKSNTEEAKNSPKKRLRSSHDKAHQIEESIRETTAVELTHSSERSTSVDLSTSITAYGSAFIHLQEPQAEIMRNIPVHGNLEDRPYHSKNIPLIFPQESSVVGSSKFQSSIQMEQQTQNDVQTVYDTSNNLVPYEVLMRKVEKGTFQMETKSQEHEEKSFANDSSGQITPWIDISTGENVINNSALFDYADVAIDDVLPMGVQDLHADMCL